MTLQNEKCIKSVSGTCGRDSELTTKCNQWRHTPREQRCYAAYTPKAQDARNKEHHGMKQHKPAPCFPLSLHQTLCNLDEKEI